MKRLLAAVLIITCIALFIRLGVWQLQRTEEKQALLDSHSQRMAQAPLNSLPSAMEVEPSRYRRVNVFGHYDAAHQVLLDNQVYNGRVGYQVLTPLRLATGGCAVLVNRGWVPALASRSELPQVPIVQTEAQVNGLIDHFPVSGMRLKGADALSPGYPVVAQSIDAARMSQHLGFCVLPYQILLAAEAGEGYLREWRMQHIDPNQSLGYAFQWFAMALGLALYVLWIVLRPRFKTKNPVDESRHNESD